MLLKVSTVAMILALTSNVAASPVASSSDTHLLDPLPAGAEGFYLGEIDANGRTIWTKTPLVEVDKSAKVNVTSLSERGVIQSRADSTCQYNINLKTTDLGTAAYQLSNQFGEGGRAIFGKYAAFAVADVVVFVCNYARQNTFTSSEMYWGWKEVDNNCGASHAGYCSREDVKKTYGRTSVNNGFC